MTTKTQIQLVLDNIYKISTPILEVGCKYYPGSRSGLREAIGVKSFVGVDAESGDNVDVVCDMTQPIDQILPLLPYPKYKTIICLSVLEHCKNPFALAENLSALLEVNGILIVGAPFVWNIHGFPDDYWRFTPSGLRLLFRQLEVDESNSFFSTKIPGEKLPFSTTLSKNDYFDTQVTGLASRACKLFMKLKMQRKKYPYMLYPVDVNMIFRKHD